MRCFIAIDLPEEIKEHLYSIQEMLPEADMKRVEKENFHLTLSFLGEITDSQLKQMNSALSTVKFEKFKSNIGKLGYFPSQRDIRVLWVGLEPSEKVKEIYSKIHEKIKNLFSLDDRFESHITLARIKFIDSREEFIKKLSAIEIEKKEFEVSSFSVKKSTLTRNGPIYENVSSFAME
jgi:2'-5' RNA ligase